MEVLHLCNEVNGGAGRAALRLHQGIQKEGISTSIFVKKGESNGNSVVSFNPNQSIPSRIRRGLRYAWMRTDFFPRYVSWPIGGMPLSDDRSRFAGEVISQVPPADLLHFHWVAEFIDIPSFLERVGMPIVWTLHDMNPLTGGCHYASGCRKFEHSCGCCPQLNSNRENDPSRRSWKRKHTAYQRNIRRDHLHIVAPSEWLAKEAERSSLLGEAMIHCIPHALDQELFCPRDTGQEREKIGIDSGRKIVLFVSQSVENSWKGFPLLRKALRNADLSGALLLSVGRGDPDVSSSLQHRHLGYVAEDKKLAILYSMADVFVIPSLQEAFGQTALESMACGTPVVGFNTGGIPDMVRPGETGWLAETGNVRSLRRAIEAALANDSERERKGTRCREVVEEEYTLDRQARRYMSLYSSILDTE